MEKDGWLVMWYIRYQNELDKHRLLLINQSHDPEVDELALR